jgi:hypothetical protein
MIPLFEYAECFLCGMLAATIFLALMCRKGWAYCPRCAERDEYLKDKVIPVVYKHKKQTTCDCEVYETCPACRDQGDQL